MLGHQLDDQMLADIINEVDADGSGELEFEEFVTLAARFMVEEDQEVNLFYRWKANTWKTYENLSFFKAMQQELKEAFRLYDKEGMNGWPYSIWTRHSTLLYLVEDNMTQADYEENKFSYKENFIFFLIENISKAIRLIRLIH
jgi:calmodulin